MEAKEKLYTPTVEWDGPRVVGSRDGHETELDPLTPAHVGQLRAFASVKDEEECEPTKVPAGINSRRTRYRLTGTDGDTTREAHLDVYTKAETPRKIYLTDLRAQLKDNRISPQPLDITPDGPAGRQHEGLYKQFLEMALDL